MKKHFTIKYIIVSIGIMLILSMILAMLAGVTMIFINAIFTVFDIDKNITYGMSFLIVLFIAIIKKML